jgi:hypothetical protein
VGLVPKYWYICPAASPESTMPYRTIVLGRSDGAGSTIIRPRHQSAYDLFRKMGEKEVVPLSAEISTSGGYTGASESAIMAVVEKRTGPAPMARVLPAIRPLCAWPVAIIPIARVTVCLTRLASAGK